MSHERLRFPISRKELERRWRLIKNAMQEKGIDALVIQNDNQWLGGYVRYFIDIPAENAYPVTVFFPLNEEMTVVTSGGEPLPPSPPAWAARGIKTRISVPYFRTLNYTNIYDAEEIVKHIKKRSDSRVGLVGITMMHAFFLQYLQANLPGVELIDCTDMVDEIKAVKSEEEIAYVRKAAQAQDIVCAAMPSIIRPGKYEFEIRGAINRILEDLGSEEQLIMIGSASPGSSTGQFPTFYQNKRINAGDQVMIMIEVNGPAGYYGEIGRTWSLGEPPQDLLDVWAVALEAQQRAALMIKPGVNPADVLEANNQFLVGKGYLAERRLFAHGQGYDLVERPAFRPEETMILKAGMNIAVHPIAFNDKAYAFCCDNFLITENGTEHLHKTPREIIVIDC